MNQKASVSKELNAKHRKILEGLLKLPENKECADCKAIAPRWASINLGIFICMQCSGAHRSLGVHISKVRSATLDTWLPEQIAFIQTMGNEKSNSYWEAELPPNYDRVGIENFIRAKYELKKWVPRDGKRKSPPRVTEQKISVYGARLENRSKHGDVKDSERSYEQKGDLPPARINSTPQQVSDDLRPKDNEKKLQVASQEPRKLLKKSEPVAPKAEPENLGTGATPISTSVKVDYATDLFNMLSMDDTTGSDSMTSASNITLASIHATETKLVERTNNNAPKPSESKVQSKYGIEDLFRDSPSVTQTISVKPQTDVKSDITNLFGKSSMVSPLSIHQQQQALLSQQQSLLTTTASNSSGTPAFPNIQPASQAIQLPAPNGRTIGQQVRGNMTSSNLQYCSQAILMKELAYSYCFLFDITSLMLFSMCQIGNGYHARPVGNAVSYSPLSMYTMMTAAPINGVRSIGASGVSTAPAKPRVTPTPSGRDFDFSSLTQGLFTKR